MTSTATTNTYRVKYLVDGQPQTMRVQAQHLDGEENEAEYAMNAIHVTGEKEIVSIEKIEEPRNA